MAYHNGFPIISSQITADELAVLLRELEQVLLASVEGDCVEFGCYEGTAALFEARLLRRLAPEKTLWLYDSFAGLPQKSEKDNSPAGIEFKSGELKASKKQLIQNFRNASLPMPVIKKAWFSELTPSDLPERICFGFFDGDFYESIWDSLLLAWPRLASGGVIMVDDYLNEKLPGATRAVDEFARRYDLRIKAEQSMAILRLNR